MNDRHERRLLDDHQIDDVARALIALTREVWVLTDRQIMLERLLHQHGIDTSAIDAADPDAETAVVLDRRRENLLAAVLGQLRGQSAGDPP
jgi:hypothetical protein